MSVLNTTNPAYLGRFVITFLAMIFSIVIGELGDTTIMVVIYTIGLGHYALHIVYSKRGLTQAWKTGRGKWILLSFLPLSVMAISNGNFIIPALVVYFGIHHAMGEVYFKNNGESSGIRIAHWVSVIGSYLAMTGQHLPPFSGLLIKLGLATMVIGTFMFIGQNRKHQKYSIRQIASYFPWIFLGPIFAVWAYTNHFDWRVLIIAHSRATIKLSNTDVRVSKSSLVIRVFSKSPKKDVLFVLF